MKGFLDVGDGHRLYYELCGNPDGLPAVFLHGGPGAGIRPHMRQLFDPARYRWVLFDQRGCGKSTPLASIENVTPATLAEDVEKIRLHLGIEKWLLGGASWGSTLALLYGLRYPQAVGAMVLSGIFYGDRAGARWLAEEGGASEMIDPCWFAPYRDLIPAAERANGLIPAYDALMTHGTEAERTEAARRFCVWDTAIIAYTPPMEYIQGINDAPEKLVPLTRLFFHFARHYYKEENKRMILDGVREKLAALPCVIVHGRFDLICPVRNAYDLHAAWPGSALHVLPETGHTLREPAAMACYAAATDSMARREDLWPSS